MITPSSTRLQILAKATAAITLALFAGMSDAPGEAAPAATERHAAPGLDRPQDERDLIAIQAQLLKVLDRAKAATVGVESDGSGSGVIITKDGYVLTAAHVSGEPGASLFIVLPDGRRVKAKSLGNKTFADAGLIKILEGGEYPTAEMAESGESQPGDWCFALGHPSGFDEDRGAVLRVGRIIRRRTETIQSDCKLLGGDSGGPLFDMRGKVIGIHSRIGASEDENFHVTVRAFHRDWEKMVAGEYLREKAPTVVRMGGYLGAQSTFNSRGLTISRVLRNSPAYAAGLRSGDIVTHIDGEKVESRYAFRSTIAGRSAMDKLNFTVLRRREELQIQVTLGRRPES
jgi:serine protease Do